MENLKTEDKSRLNKRRGAVSGLRKTYERFIKIRGEPRDIAMGFALGLFLGFSPMFGFQVWVAILLAALFKWNKIAAALGTVISNPITTPFIYVATYYVGSKLFDTAQILPARLAWDFDMLVRILSKTPQVFWAWTLGGVIIGLPLACFGYYLSYAAIVRYRTQLRQRVVEKRKLLKERVKKRRSRGRKKGHWKTPRKTKRKRAVGTRKT
ncbi:MAG: DUF2062 domain-containing protein [Desulfobacteraceae bacterium]|nr:DUF2062 domain-containing protein [Desulfobacteraceae bacterium]